MPKLRLLKIFEDVKPTYQSITANDSYVQEFEIVRKPNPEPITIEKLEQYVSNLNNRFPDREFFLKEVEIDGRKLYLLSQKRIPERRIEQLEKELVKAREELEQLVKKNEEMTKEFNMLNDIHTSLIEKLERIERKPFIIRLFYYFEARRIKKLLVDLRKRLSSVKRSLDILKMEEAAQENHVSILEEELERLRTEGVDGVIPLYFDLEAQEVFIPASVWRAKKKNATYVIHRCLGALGLSTTRYLRTVGRVIHR